MKEKLMTEISEMKNLNIFDSFLKCESVMNGSNTALCSISGGSDSDIVLDMLSRMETTGQIIYYWVNTGLEYQATKDHLDFLEQKYQIQIERIKAVKPIPACVKEYGVPFLSK